MYVIYNIGRWYLYCLIITMAPLGDIHITNATIADNLVNDLSEEEFDRLSKARARKKQAVVTSTTTDVAANLST